jgi:hypothetical protein
LVTELQLKSPRFEDACKGNIFFVALGGILTIPDCVLKVPGFALVDPIFLGTFALPKPGMCTETKFLENSLQVLFGQFA